MKYPLFTTLCLLIFFYKSATAQFSTRKSASNAFYIEALGMGGYGSINYERLLFNKKQWHVGVRLGAGTYRLRDFETNLNPDITIPLAFNAYYGYVHHFEIGLGQTITSIVKASPVNFKVMRENSVSSNFNIGYRYQKNAGGLVFRVNYNPIISRDRLFKNWYGVSFGYAF